MKRTWSKKRGVIGGAVLYRKWNEFSEGDIVVGKYVKSSEDQYGKKNFHFEVLDTSFHDKKAGDLLLGKVWCANSCGSLDKAMEEVQLGEIVQIEYTGLSELTKGPYAGKEVHSMVVDIVSEDGADDVEEDYGL